MSNISTSDLNRVLRLNLTTDMLLVLLNEKPAEVIKGNPRWSQANCVSICEKLSKHFAKQAMAFRVVAAVDDDDEL